MRSKGAALAIAVLTACGPSSSDSTDPARDDAPEPALRWSSHFPALVGTSTGPAPYRQARVLWRTATVAFSRGDYEAAADGFLTVADRLRRTTLAHPEHEGAFRATRCLAYENVAAIYAGLPTLEQGAAQLRKARVEDPDCQHTLSRSLARLGAVRRDRRAPARAER
jgi:hypothetical protein